MLSCGETILASDAEVQEFYSLAKALGMDKKSGESTVNGPEQEPPLPHKEGEEHSTADLTPMEEEADHQDESSEEDGEEMEGEEGLVGNSGDSDPGKQMENEDKEKKFEQQKQCNEQCQNQEEKDLDETSRDGDGVIDLAKDRPRAATLQKVQNNEERKLWKLCKSNSSAGFDCLLCKRYFSRFPRFLDHLCISHFMRCLIKKNRLDSQKLNRVGGARVRCTECHLTFKNPANLIRHHGVVHKQVVIMALEAHLKKGADAATDTVRVFPLRLRGLGSGSAGDAKVAKWARLKSLCPGSRCPFCTYVEVSGRFANLLQHMSIHFRSELECKRPETRKGQHQLEEDGRTRVWKCKECTSKFAGRSHLMTHYGTVHGDTLDPALEELEERRAAALDDKEKMAKLC